MISFVKIIVISVLLMTLRGRAVRKKVIFHDQGEGGWVMTPIKEDDRICEQPLIFF